MTSNPLRYRITKADRAIKGELMLPSSKSESNRALIIQALCEENFEIKNLSASSDTVSLNKYLSEIRNSKTTSEIKTIDIADAGTAMRFLSAYLSITEGNWFLTGSHRMKDRPVGALIDALIGMGADIEFAEKKGYPPLKIKGKKIKGGEIEVNGTISSQFITALLLIAPILELGLIIKINGELVSRPYVAMTIKMMNEFGVEAEWKNGTITIPHQQYNTAKLPVDESGNKYYLIDADWTAISYWYETAAIAEESEIILKGIKPVNIQGDAIVGPLFTLFGVKTEQIPNGIKLTKLKVREERFGYDFSDNPDIAQTIAVTATAMNITCLLNGLQTLKIKETDRIQALKNELEKFGASVEIMGDEGVFITPISQISNLKSQISINTYKDHRMAMSFAPMALVTKELIIEDPAVVKKSYPNFWEHLKVLGFEIEELF